MKTTILILTFMCNACYGQYIDSFVIVYKMQSGNTEVVTRNAKPTYDMADSVWLNYDETWIVYRWKPTFDSVTMYGNEPPVYHRKKDTVLVERLYYNNSRDTFVVTHYDTIVQYNKNSLFGYKKDTSFYYNNNVYWGYFYSVREQHNYNENGIINGQMQYQWRVMGENGNNYWKHLYYLDSKKKKLSKNIVVWQSIEVLK